MNEAELDHLKKALIRIYDQHYTVDLNYTDFKKGDVVFDKKDRTHGVVVNVKDGFAAVGEAMAVELGIDLSRLIKLNPVLSEKTTEVKNWYL